MIKSSLRGRLRRTGLALLVLVFLLVGAAALFAQDNPPHDGQPQFQSGPEPSEVPPQHGGSAQGHEGNLQAISIMLLALLLGLCSFAVLTLVIALAPERTAAIVASAPGSFLMRFLVGVANSAFVLVLIKASHNVLAIPIVPFLLVLFVMGLFVLSDEVGKRLQIVTGAEWNRLTRLGAGWTTLYLASWFPVLGWFVIAPVTALTAVGTMLLWLLTKRVPEAPVAAAPASTPPPAPAA